MGIALGSILGLTPLLNLHNAALDGDAVRARWSVKADRVRWARDSGTAASPVGDDAARTALEQRLRELTRLPGVRLP